ncbi:YdcF family protein [Nocardia sp. BMG111209]|uniref:YdcF family protein n=1 Tax=Nocardia sp. BMG111209 TaxID=1160137 RepID=UPI0018CA372C|nr:YdcF family protein [Nocardia sp. BMG111209]
MSAVNRDSRELTGTARTAVGKLIEGETRTAIPLDSSGRALIADDRVLGGRREAAYDEWLNGLRARGVDTDRALTHLGTIYDYVRRDPAWEIEAGRHYGGTVVFGSPDIGGAGVVANMVFDHGLAGVPVVFSGYQGEAEAFRVAAERLGLAATRCYEEPLARNTVENAIYGVEVLRAGGRDTSSLIAVTNPFHARRVWATLMKRPEVEHVSMGVADVSLENYLKYGFRTEFETVSNPDKIAANITGEIPRYEEYARNGDMVEVAVPDHVRAAYEAVKDIFRPLPPKF